MHVEHCSALNLQLTACNTKCFKLHIVEPAAIYNRRLELSTAVSPHRQLRQGLY